MSEFTKEEVTNVLVLIEAGARALSSQNKLDQASAILATADTLSKKLSEALLPKEVKAE